MRSNFKQQNKNWQTIAITQFSEQLNTINTNVSEQPLETLENEQKERKNESCIQLVKTHSPLIQHQNEEILNQQEANQEATSQRKTQIMRLSRKYTRKFTVSQTKKEPQITQENFYPQGASIRSDKKQNSLIWKFQDQLNNNNQDDNQTDSQQKQQQATQINRVERFQNINIAYPALVIPMKSGFKLIWDIFITLVLFWSILYMPWELAFPDDTIPKHNYFLLVVFLLDLLISFRTTFYNDEQDEIIGSKEMFFNYVKSPYFILDLISTIPFDLIDSSNSNGKSSSSTIAFLKFLKLIRLLRLLRIISKVKSESLQVAGTLVKYMFLLLIVLHWQTLIWWTLISQQGDSSENSSEFNTWLPIIYHVLKDSSSLDVQNISREILQDSIPKHIKYIYTLYSMIMLVLGGELTPVSSTQAFVATIFAFIGQITFAAIFANMTSALFQIRQHHQQQAQIKEKFNQQMHIRQLPKVIKQNVNEYINFCFHNKIIFNTDLQEFSDLNAILQQQISLVIHQKIIQDAPLFSQLNSYEISLITSKLSTRVLMPNEIVFNIGEIISEMHFIVKGVVKMTKQYGKNQYKSEFLSEGEHFGEYSIMQFWCSDYRIEATTFSIIQVLHKRMMKSILAQAPALEQKIIQGLKLYKQEEKYNFYNNFKNLDIFQGLNEKEMNNLYINYIENINVNPNEIIIVPQEQINSLYLILDGKVMIYQENTSLLRVNVNSNNIYKDKDIFYNSVDDLIYQKINNNNSKISQMQEIEDKVHLVGEINSGQYFGLIDHSLKRHLKNNSLVLMSSMFSVKLGIINQNIMHLLLQEEYQLYKKLMNNLSQINRLFPNMQVINKDNITLDDLIQITPQIFEKRESKILQKDESDDNDLDTTFIRLREILNQVQNEVKDVHRKTRIVKPPIKNIIIN